MKKLILILIATILTNIMTAQWQWQNPTPQPSGIIDIFFFDENNGWASCNNDTILKTIDGGQSWKMRDYPAEQVLWRIRFFDLQLGIAIADDGIILKSIDGGENWEIIPAITSQHLYDLCLATSGKGWIAGDSGVVLKTDDFGSTWTEQSNGIGQVERFDNICFVSENDGWVKGTDYNSEACLYRTQDGGLTWTQLQVNINNPYNGYLEDIFFIDSLQGWWAWKGDPNGSITGWIYHTNDGGENWELIYEMNDGTSVIDIQFTDPMNGWVTTEGDYTGFYIMPILHTNDGGYTWSAQYFNFQHDIGPDKLYFLNNNHGWTASGAHISHTSDGGLTWESQTGAQTHFFLQDISIINENSVRILGNRFWVYPHLPCILSTDNGGANGSWTQTYYTGEFKLNCLSFTDMNNGWAAGDKTLIHTIDGGLNWGEIYTWWLQYANIHEMYFINAMKGWLVGSKNWNPAGGVILHTSDNGINWEVQLSGTENDFNNVYFIDDNNGWVVGDNGDIRNTNDGGSLWENQFSGTNYDLNEVFFIDTQSGWIVGDSGIIIHTSDGGNTWELQNSSTDIELHSVCFLDQNNGWVVGSIDMFPIPFFSGGVTLYTDDGGISWQNKTGNYRFGQSKVSFLDQNNGWMIGNSGSIKYCDNGIITGNPELKSFDSETTLKVYPVPAHNTANIEFNIPGTSKVQIAVYDVFGKCIQKVATNEFIKGNHQITWNMGGLPSGVYSCILITPEVIKSRKIVKL